MTIGSIFLVAFIISLVQAESVPVMCKCPVLKQVDAEVYAKMRAQQNMSIGEIPKFAPLDIDYGDDCTQVSITCLYPRFTRHRSSVYYTNGVNFSTVRRHDLSDKYSIRCNQMTGVWLSDENSEISYIQCAYRPMLVNKVFSGIWEEFSHFFNVIWDILKTNFGFLKFIVGYE